MFTLRFGHDWASQIQVIRDATTEDTNLIRFDNGFYRICRAQAPDFAVNVFPSRVEGQGVRMTLRSRDLYITNIAGVPFENYAATLESLSFEAPALDHTIMSLRKNAATTSFEMKSFIVLCIAESLRSDHVATRVGQFIRTATTGMLGVSKFLPIGELLREARTWGQTSEAIFRALSPEARGIVLLERARLTPTQRQFSERIKLHPADKEFEYFARMIKVIKRPG